MLLRPQPRAARDAVGDPWSADCGLCDPVELCGRSSHSGMGSVSLRGGASVARSPQDRRRRKDPGSSTLSAYTRATHWLSRSTSISGVPFQRNVPFWALAAAWRRRVTGRTFCPLSGRARTPRIGCIGRRSRKRVARLSRGDHFEVGRHPGRLGAHTEVHPQVHEQAEGNPGPAGSNASVSGSGLVLQQDFAV